MNNSTTFAIFLLVGTFLTSTITMLPAAYAGVGESDDNNDKRGDGNKQRVEDESAGALNDCDAVENEFEDTTFENVNECIAITAADESIGIRDGGTTTPPPDDGFTVTGEGSEGSAECENEPPSEVEWSIIFSAEGEDGTVTGTYTVSVDGLIREGVITEGTTDGNTYTLSGENNSVCGPALVDEITISGDCGDDVTITYEDPFSVITFTGDVDCTLVA